jgi:phenylacetate-CoA ligase
MATHPPPPFDAWLWAQAWQETWLAGLWPATAQALRAQRLAALLREAAAHSPIYQRRLKGSPSFSAIEPIDKTELMQHFDEWATDRRITRALVQPFIARTDNLADGLLGRYLVWTSSGSSGLPGWFVQDARSLAAYDAIDALRLRGQSNASPLSLGVWGLRERFAFVGAEGGHYAGVVSMQRLRRTVPAPLQPAIRILSVLQPLRAVAGELMRWQPTVLITYPSAADALAQMQRKGEMALRLREVWVGGEQLSAAQRADMAAAFGCAVRNNYGASECFSIAWECAHGHLHVNDDWVVLEPVDERLRPVPPGVLSHTTLLTNLANHTQPIVRYRLDDRVRVQDTPCACGSPFTAIEVRGRSGDTLLLKGTKGARSPSVAILPLALETAIEEQAGTAAFQLIAHLGQRPPVLELRFEQGVEDQQRTFEDCRDAINVYLESQGVARMPCRHSREPPARDAHSGKFKRVVCAAG